MLRFSHLHRTVGLAVQALKSNSGKAYHYLFEADILHLLQMLEDHLSEKALIPALRFVAENHPQRLARSDSKQEQKVEEADRFEDKLHEIVVDGMDQRTRATGLGSSPERQIS